MCQESDSYGMLNKKLIPMQFLSMKQQLEFE